MDFDAAKIARNIWTNLKKPFHLCHPLLLLLGDIIAIRAAYELSLESWIGDAWHLATHSLLTLYKQRLVVKDR